MSVVAAGTRLPGEGSQDLGVGTLSVVGTPGEVGTLGPGVGNLQITLDNVNKDNTSMAVFN